MVRDTLVTVAARVLSAVFPRGAAPPASCERILVLKPCCLGDVVLATPVLGALRQAFPQAHIDVAVGSWSRAVVAHNPHVHAVLDTGAVGQGRYDWGDV